MFTQNYGRTLPLAGFFLSLIFTGFQTFGCLEFWSEEGDSASDVFIQFVKENLGEKWSKKMNSKKYKRRSGGYSTLWEYEITQSTQKWSSKNAREFLEILVRRVGAQNTCYLLARSLSHLQNMHHNRDKISQDILQNFKDRLAFYDESMGEETTTEMMRKSLAGFTEGALYRIKELTKFLKTYLRSKKLVIGIFMRNPHIYSVTRVDEIQPVLNFLEILISHETLKGMMTRKKADSKYGRYLSLSKLKTLQNILQPLIHETTVVSVENRDHLQREILKLAELSYDHLLRIQRKVTLWVTYSDLSAVAQAMKEDIEILHEPGLYEIEKKMQTAEKESQDKKSLFIFIRQKPDFFVRSSVDGFLEGFRKWLSPSPKKSAAKPKSRRRSVRSIKGNPDQMIIPFPDEEQSLSQ